MANMKTFFLGICALAGLVQAAPMAEVTYTNTVTKTAYKTKVCTATIWLPAGQSPLANATPSGQSTTVRTSTRRPAASHPVTGYHTQSPAPAPTTSAYVPPPAPTTTTTTSVYVAPPPETTPTSVYVPETTTPAYTPPAPVTTESPAYVAPVPTSSEAPAPVATTTDAPAAATTTPASQPGQFVDANSSNTCESTSQACEGDVTHWDGGLGACGWTVNTDSDMAVALPVGLMGSQSNGNPYCGRSISIKNPNSGTIVQAKVGDKCMGCEGRAIDLTNALFTAVTDGTGDGRESGYEWWFD